MTAVPLSSFEKRYKYYLRFLILTFFSLIVNYSLIESLLIGDRLNILVSLFTAVLTPIILYTALRSKNAFSIDCVKSFECSIRPASRLKDSHQLKIESNSGEVKTFLLFDFGFNSYLRLLIKNQIKDNNPKVTAELLRIIDGMYFSFIGYFALIPTVITFSSYQELLSSYYKIGSFYITKQFILITVIFFFLTTVFSACAIGICIIYNFFERTLHTIRSCPYIKKVFAIFSGGLLLAPIFSISINNLLKDQGVPMVINSKYTVETFNKRYSLLVDKRYRCITCSFSIKKGDSIAVDIGNGEEKRYQVLAARKKEYQEHVKSTKRGPSSNSSASFIEGEVFVKSGKTERFISIDKVKGKVLATNWKLY